MKMDTSDRPLLMPLRVRRLVCCAEERADMNMARTRCEEETSGNWRVGARKFSARGWSAMNKGRDWPHVTFIPAGIAKNKDAATTNG